jgi:lysozyme family protein
MRFLSTAIVIAILSLTYAYAFASDGDNGSTALAALQSKANQAQPRERCFLYAEFISQMTDLAGEQFNSGDSGQASQTLKLVQRYAEKIHIEVADDSKKLRDAELLIRRTSFRLKGILSVASYEDRPALEVTLKQLNEIQSELLMHVFTK